MKSLYIVLALRFVNHLVQSSPVLSDLIRVRTLRALCRLTNLIIASTTRIWQPCLLQNRISRHSQRPVHLRPFVGRPLGCTVLYFVLPTSCVVLRTLNHVGALTQTRVTCAHSLLSSASRVRNPVVAAVPRSVGPSQIHS